MKLTRDRLLVVILVLYAVPFLGICFGAVYALPAIFVSKSRDPWLTILLAGGLAVTTFGLGSLTQASLLTLAGIWLGSVVLLLFARIVYGNLGHNLESFGEVHMVTLCLLIIWVTWMNRV